MWKRKDSNMRHKWKLVGVYFWWFLILHTEGPAVVGPFPTQARCQDMREWVTHKTSYFAAISPCWTDEPQPAEKEKQQ